MVLVAGPGDPFSQLRCEARQGGEDRRRYVIDVDEAAVVELPWEIRSADPQLAGESGITIKDASCFGPSPPTFEGCPDGRVHTHRTRTCSAIGQRPRMSTGLGAAPVARLNEPPPNRERQRQAATDQQDDQYSARCAAAGFVRCAAERQGDHGHEQRHHSAHGEST